MNKITNGLRIALLVIVTLFSSALLSQTSFAKSSLNAEDEAMFSQNDILFYEPCGGAGGEKASSEICGDNKNYAGVQVFTDEQMKAIKANQPFYQEAAEKYGIPWEVIAVIHKREHGLARSNPSNGQGVYQFASAERRASCKGGNFSPGKISDDQFQIQTNCAADAIKNSYGSGLDLNTDDGVKKMFFKYNGMAQVYIDQALKLGFSQAEAENGEGSPYVMNRYDEKREPSSTWGQIKRDYGSIEYPANNDFGAFTMYKALTCTGESIVSDDPEDDGTESEDENDTDDNGSSSSNISSSSDTAKKIAETALRLAYSYEDRGKADEDPKQEFIDATTELGTWDKNKAHGPDCGYFVKAVIATVAPDIVYKPKDEKMDPFRNQLVSESNSWSTKDNKYTKEYWDVIDFSDGSVSKLQSGDIVWGYSGSKQHYFIVSEINGKLYKVEAHYGSSKGVKKRWGRVSKKLGKTFKTYTVQKIFRAKGGDSSKPSCDANLEGSKNINATGAALAWPLGTDEAKYTLSSGEVLESALTSPGQTTDFAGTGSGNLEFQKAWVKAGIYKNSNLGSGTMDGRYSWRYGAYCSGFTAAVVRYSGYDKSFTSSASVGVYEQANHAREHSDLWDVDVWDGEKSSLQGGDILLSAEHSWMVVEDSKGEMYVAEASLHGYTFGHIVEYYKGYNSKTYRIRAKHANNSNVGVSVTDGVKTSSTTGTITSSVQNSKNIGAVARFFAWPKGTDPKTTIKGPKEPEVWKTLLKDNGFSNFSETAMGKDCGVFVGGVLRYAGLVTRIKHKNGQGIYPIVPSEVDEGENGWYRVDTDGTNESELQDGDVIFHYKEGKLSHFSIFLRGEKGEALTAQASHGDWYGRISNYSPYGQEVVYRNRNNKTGGNSDNSKECNLCANEESSEDDGGGTLKDGGLTMDEAKKLVDIYKGYAGENNLRGNTAIANKYYIKVGCHGNLFLNCPSFVKYFVNRYTTKKWTSGLTGDGKETYKYLADALGLQTGSSPQPYAVFSDDSYSPGHTGVVLSVDSAKGTMIIGEAGCNGRGTARSAYDFIGAKEVSINKYHLYTYLEPIINLTGQ